MIRACLHHVQIKAQGTSRLKVLAAGAPHRMAPWSLAELLQGSSLEVLAVGACTAARRRRGPASLPGVWDHESRLLYLDVKSTPDAVLLAGLVCLKVLCLSNKRVAQLPHGIGALTALQLLNLSGCTSLQQLPETIGTRAALQKVNLKNCASLQLLPNSIGNLAALQRLELTWCISLQQLPDRIGALSALQRLNLRKSQRCSSCPTALAP